MAKSPAPGNAEGWDYRDSADSPESADWWNLKQFLLAFPLSGLA